MNNTKKLTSMLAVFLLMPAMTLAVEPISEGGIGRVGEFGQDILLFINGVLVPFLLAVALVMFIYGVYALLIQSGGEEDSRDAGRRYMLWGIIAFVIILSVWGLTNLIAEGLGLREETLESDRIPQIDPRE